MKTAKNGEELKPTTIGQAFGGGFYAGQITDGNETFYLIAAPKKAGEATKEWLLVETGAISKTSGPGNTDAILNCQNIQHPASQFCKDLNIDGHSDWYLPSKDELAVLCAARKAFAAAGQAFVDFSYWSSTEYDAYYAWFQNFSDGNQSNGFKGYGFYVRAVRRLKI